MLFHELTTTQKGDVGEEIIDALLKKKGVIPYKPDADRAHPFDRLCASINKKSLYVVEVKAKSKRKYYPDTGINLSVYTGYQHINAKYNMQVYLFFVDEESAEIYGGELNKISTPCQITHNGKVIDYPLISASGPKDIIYFPIARMGTISKINDADVSKLKSLTTKQLRYI